MTYVMAYSTNNLQAVLAGLGPNYHALSTLTPPYIGVYVQLSNKTWSAIKTRCAFVDYPNCLFMRAVHIVVPLDEQIHFQV